MNRLGADGVMPGLDGLNSLNNERKTAMIALTFPGENTIKISQEALRKMLQETLQAQFGAAVRVTNLEFPGNYSSSPMAVDFTTDPEKAPRVSPVPAAPSVEEDPL